MKVLDKKFNFLIPIKNTNLSRFGIKADGGYVVDREIMLRSDNLITFGLGGDWSFELDFLKVNKNSKIFVYDHTVSLNDYISPLIKYIRRFLTLRSNFYSVSSRINNLRKYLSFTRSKNIFFFKEKICSQVTKDTGESDLKKVFSRIDKNKKNILKIDIEGSEFEIIDQINFYSKNIEMIIFEFHWLDKNEDLFINSLKKLQENFDIIHLHGNNHCGQLESGLPITIEVTMTNNKLRPSKISYVKNFPNKDLDHPNNPHKEDIFFSFD